MIGTLTKKNNDIIINLKFFLGALVEFDVTQSVGHRVVSLLLRCGDCRVPKYEPLVLTANYTIVMNSYIAEGGDRYEVFRKTLRANQILG